MFLSIDFEDFSHDLKRDLGLWKTGPMRIDSLWESYHEINAFLKEIGGSKGQKATFFCTGIIAEQAPDLVKKIAEDGHEIACHYYFHDEMYQQDLTTVEANLKRAKYLLETSSGSQVFGFRAPKFKIDKMNAEQYQAVQSYFAYDSSFPVQRLSDIKAFKELMNLDKLEILPIFRDTINGIDLKLGGSYLKVFPKIMSKKLMVNAESKGFVPHIYIHPYEVNAKQKYRVSLKELKPLGLRRSIYWSFRQHQWLSVGNISLKKKLRSLVGPKGLRGRLCDNFLLKR